MKWSGEMMGPFGKASGTTRRGRGFGTYSAKFAGRVNHSIREEAGDGGKGRILTFRPRGAL